MPDRRSATRCSFCGKSQDQVRKLVHGPGVFICDGCIELCNEVLRESGTSVPSSARYRTMPRKKTFSGWFRNLFRAHGYTT